MFYLTTHSTHFINCYMASDIWLRTILIVRKETRCQHIGYSYRLTARVLLYAPSHRQDNTYHSLCYTSHGALAGTRTQREVIEVKIRRCCKGCENRLLKNNRWHQQHFVFIILHGRTWTSEFLARSGLPGEENKCIFCCWFYEYLCL